MTNIHQQKAGHTILNVEQLTINAISINESTVRGIEVKEEFISSIEKVEFPGVTLSSIFVCPDFYYISGTEEKEIEVDTIDIFFESNDSNTCFLKGSSLSGKSSIGKKVFLRGLELNYLPLLMNGCSINKGNIDFDKIIMKEFSERYNGDFNEYKGLKNKIIIVDDYHFQINKKFLDYCKSNFDKIIFIISDDDFTMYFKDEQDYINFNVFGIKEFSNLKQHKLMINWFKKDYIQTDESQIYNKEFDLIESRINDITTKNHIVPRYPFFLLSIIQAFDNLNTRDYSITSYGHCYQTLILHQLSKKGINPNEYPYCLNFLKNLAFTIFNSNNVYGIITEENYGKFKTEYSKNYTQMSKASLTRLENDLYAIFRIKDGNIKFEFEYIYYYFVGNYISENEECINIITNLCETIYRKSSSNILIFTIHHSRNPKLLEEIQLHCMTSFDNLKPTLLTKEETNFLESAVSNLPDSIIKNNSISQNRENEQKMKDKNEKKGLELSDNDIEQDKELTELSKAFKILEVLGQILKNRSGDLHRSKLEELLFEIENLGLRIMSHLMNTLKSESFHSVIESMIESLEKHKGKKLFISQEEKFKKINEFIQKMGVRTVIGLLYKIFNSVNVEQLLLLQRNITKNNSFPSYELLYLLFEINNNTNNNVIDIEKIKIIYSKFEEEKNFLAMKTLSFFVQIYMNNHNVRYDIRQKIFNLFGIKGYIPNKILNIPDQK